VCSKDIQPPVLTTFEHVTTILAMDACEYNFPIRVLIYQEDEETIAHAIEMDIVADGETHEEAVSHLKQLIKNQITFAIQKGEEHLIWRRAPKEYFERWESAQEQSIRNLSSSEKRLNLKAKAIVIAFAEEEIERLRKRSKKHGFSEMAIA
jgi:uncharacterized protein (DUF302 family)